VAESSLERRRVFSVSRRLLHLIHHLARAPTDLWRPDAARVGLGRRHVVRGAREGVGGREHNAPCPTNASTICAYYSTGTAIACTSSDACPCSATDGRVKAMLRCHGTTDGGGLEGNQGHGGAKGATPRAKAGLITCSLSLVSTSTACVDCMASSCIRFDIIWRSILAPGLTLTRLG